MGSHCVAHALNAANCAICTGATAPSMVRRSVLDVPRVIVAFSSTIHLRPIEAIGTHSEGCLRKHPRARRWSKGLGRWSNPEVRTVLSLHFGRLQRLRSEAPSDLACLSSQGGSASVIIEPQALKRVVTCSLSSRSSRQKTPRFGTTSDAPPLPRPREAARAGPSDAADSDPPPPPQNPRALCRSSRLGV